MPEKSHPFHVRIPIEMHNKLIEGSARAGKKVPGYARDCFDLGSGLNPGAWKDIYKVAEIFNVDTSTVIENIFARYMAELTAWEKVYPDRPRIAHEFMPTSKGVLKGKQLFDLLVNEFENQFREQFEMEKKAGVFDWNTNDEDD